MIITSIHTPLRVALLVGTAVYFLIILLMLKRQKLTVRYALLWLVSGAALLLFAIFPYIVLVLRDLLQMEMPVNVVYLLCFGFVFLLLLSLTSAVSTFSTRIKQLTQASALLEKRVRDLEQQLAHVQHINNTDSENNDKK